ncbi:MAG TPA: HAD-IA family hydrolase [Anaerolineales bacterium]|nr:HAD-IA family hydrolase [Anaerolineales bacterium]
MNSSIRALLFDFDGVVLDTETPEVLVWKRIYSEYGFEFPVERVLQTIGHMGYPNFDPAQTLHEWTRDSLDPKELHARHRRESNELIEQEPVGEGVLEVIAQARMLGLKIAIASSSPRTWVEPHLKRLGLAEAFDLVVTSDLVTPGRFKPLPDIYLKALELLALSAAQTLAFEDSPPGIRAAHGAGVFVVAVPNPVTAQLDLEDADFKIQSLCDVNLPDLLERAAR